MEMGSSSLGVLGSSGSNDSIHGLKFGEKIYFEDVGNAVVTVPATAPASVANGGKHPAPGRKGKGGGQGAQQHPPRCQVEGCKVDLTGTKTYYCRHKVCGMHSKSPKVKVSGMEQRFCQQCSRFHQLHEFDQGKRSCRRRLTGHNERRRKAPSSPISTRYGRLSSSIHDGSRFRGYHMDFTYPTLSAAATDAWSTVRPENHPAHHPCQGTLAVPPSSRVSGQMIHLYRQGSAMFANHDVRTTECLGISDSSCALSLLSNQPWASADATSSRSPVMISANNYGVNPVVQSNVGTSFLNNTWNFKEHETSSTVLELPSEMCLALAGGGPPGSMNGQFSVEHEPNNRHFSGELELALQGSKEYASFGNLVHWSL